MATDNASDVRAQRVALIKREERVLRELTRALGRVFTAEELAELFDALAEDPESSWAYRQVAKAAGTAYAQESQVGRLAAQGDAERTGSTPTSAEAGSDG